MAEDHTGKVMYITPQSKCQGVKLCGKQKTANGGVLWLAKDEDAELQELIATGDRSDLAQAFQRFDIDGAEAVAKAHMAKNMARPAATNGTTTSNVDPGQALRHAQVTQSGEAIAKTGGLLDQLNVVAPPSA